MTELGRMHTFHAWAQPDGGMAMELFRRSDLHELTAIGLMVVKDKAADVRRLGDLICEALDRELVTRAKQG